MSAWWGGIITAKQLGSMAGWQHGSFASISSRQNAALQEAIVSYYVTTVSYKHILFIKLDPWSVQYNHSFTEW